MTVARHDWTSVPVGELRPGDVIRPTSRSGSRQVAQVQRSTRWDGVDTVTVIDTHGRGLAARRADWLVLTLRRADDGAAA